LKFGRCCTASTSAFAANSHSNRISGQQALAVAAGTAAAKPADS
jgi:hypothetical protein